VAPRAPRDAIRAGIALVPEDRGHEGIVPEMSVRENVSLAALPTLTRLGVVDRRRQRAVVDDLVRRLGVRMASPDQRVRELSGGNQQKVLLARWLATRPALLIADEPTRGIDLGARGEIHALLRELAASGLGVLMISSDLEELVEGSSRVVVLRDGRDVGRIAGDALTEDAIVHAMAGAPEAAPEGAPDAGPAASPAA
jgi:galactofuranose transport system ATP-binding protein